LTAADTNVIIRFLVRDDEKQAKLVYRRLKQAESNRTQVFISLAVVLETIWVLESAYDKSRAEILDAITDMRQMRVFSFEKDEVIERLVNDGRRFKKADLSDILIAHSAQSCGCGKGDTFDKGAAKLPFFDLLK
jgi:predicted nucleic-acid-binding protein